MAVPVAPAQRVRLALRANWQQFALLVVVNVIAGGVLTLASGLLAARRITGRSSHVGTPRPATALRC